MALTPTPDPGLATVVIDVDAITGEDLAMVTRAVIFLVRQNANQILDQP